MLHCSDHRFLKSLSGLLCLFLFCVGQTAVGQAISSFTSIVPGAPTQQFRLPASTHTFQYLLEEGDALSLGGTFSGANDFAGYVPVGGSSALGYLGINTETNPAGELTILDIHFDPSPKKWLIDQSGKVDFADVEGTRNNCSGGITPWGTLLTCEENKSSASTNSAGFYKYGYCVEVNPATREVVNYPGGLANADKIWKMGYGDHENACIRPEQNRVLYTGLDDPAGFLYKFVADVSGSLDAGKLYVLKKTSATNGQWKLIQNSTVAQVNATLTQSAAVGGQTYNGIEDVEIGPDGKVYFAVKNESSVYRFTDVDPLCATDSTVTNFITYVGGSGVSYSITTASGTYSAAWGVGNDNLAFDNLGNLWVLQDGGNMVIWLVETGHTQAVPKVKYFGNAPAGAEPTGITFTPDFNFMFLSFQHPNSANEANQTDAFLMERDFNKAVTIAVARKEFLGNLPLPVELVAFDARPTAERVEITWQTASESNSREFLIERMNDRDGPWEIIGSVAASGWSEGLRDYRFRDENPFVGGNYYRLRGVDFDGKTWLSDVELAHFRPVNRSSGGQIAPNPIRNGQLRFDLFEPESGPLEACVIDILGFVRLREELPETTDGSFFIHATGLRPGNYFLQVRSERRSVLTGKFAVD